MTQTVTATYDDILKAINAFDELVSEGIDREKLFLDRETNQLKVIVPEDVQRQVESILERHEPEKVWAQPYQEQ
ncbi:hypothetical protein L861_22525 [Litchfieldella anticariensis FP35 = DSM 16096]|uniref:Uncharacterized protein n=1 Tax=Litchfieldella anticariensis (strain DSM 16096 / CECT 5854 / CIP 108499 / LMG 22089 / FP35) TaxID=1121939 RepID=S2KRG3_LITA3|nr:hypothetical protein [Halomonas anticariensis]EPC03088.1 hypothetical protein L861_22525 [Halomonas anticariensis FP35 = DSM 16096]